MANSTDAYLSRMVADNPCIAVRNADGMIKKLDVLRGEIVHAVSRMGLGRGGIAKMLGIGERYVRKTLKRGW